VPPFFNVQLIENLGMILTCFLGGVNMNGLDFIEVRKSGIVAQSTNKKACYHYNIIKNKSITHKNGIVA
jgi:hypothetical protein